MLAFASSRPINTIRSPKAQKVKTWKFAAQFLFKNATMKDKAELGRFTKQELLELGPTFIKIGQFISTRGDLYPLEFVKELESLQDDVTVVEYDDSKIPYDIFSEIDMTTPFKCASIGQVYRATLKENNKEVIVKVKRPNIKEIMTNDTNDIKDIVNFLERINIDTGTGNGVILDEAIDNLIIETDYVKEKENAIQFYNNFKDVPWVRVPKVYEEYCTEDILVMEYVPSEKLNDIETKGVNKKKICEALIRSYVKQTMEDGFFHADPHPGNVGFAPDGKLVYYDFGLCVPISDELKNGFMELLVHIVERDTKSIVQKLVDLKIIIPQTELGDIEIFFESILSYMEKLDPKNLAEDIMNDEILMELAKEKPFVIPSSFIYLAKTFSIVEGLCLKLDPEFNYFTYLEPIIQNKVSQSIDMSSMVKTVAEMPTRVKNLSTAVLSLEKSRAAVKRSLKKTRKEIRYAQYSILCTLIALEQQNQYVFVFFASLAAWFALTSRKNQ